MRAACLFPLALVLPGLLGAQDMPVPKDVQVAIFQKVFTYDRSVQDGDSLDVLVVHEGESNGAAEEIANSFQEVGISARTVGLDRLSDEIDRAFAAYVLQSASSAYVQELCAANHVLSISGAPELAERGDVSIAIGRDRRKPELVIHLSRLRAEGHALSSELLKLARIIR